VNCISIYVGDKRGVDFFVFLMHLMIAVRWNVRSFRFIGVGNCEFRITPFLLRYHSQLWFFTCCYGSLQCQIRLTFPCIHHSPTAVITWQ